MATVRYLIINNKNPRKKNSCFGFLVLFSGGAEWWKERHTTARAGNSTSTEASLGTVAPLPTAARHGPRRPPVHQRHHRTTQAPLAPRRPENGPIATGHTKRKAEKKEKRKRMVKRCYKEKCGGIGNIQYISPIWNILQSESVDFFLNPRMEAAMKARQASSSRSWISWTPSDGVASAGVQVSA